MRHATRVLLVALVISVTLAAQRSPFFATVVDVEGKLLADAEVTCAFVRDRVTAGGADIVTGKTDKRGRARLNLIIGRLYEAWAIGSAEVDGTRMVTRPVPLIAAGRIAELRAIERVVPRKVQLTGVTPWRGVGAVGLRWFPNGLSDVYHDFELPSGDEVVLPPGPWIVGSLGLRDSSGETLVATRVEPGVDELPEFAAPLEIEVTVQDVLGTPIAGVQIEHHVNRNAWRRRLLESGFQAARHVRSAATTGEDGIARFHVPDPPDHNIRGRVRVGRLILHAVKQGFATAHAVVSESQKLSFHLIPRDPTRVRIVGGHAPMQLQAFGSYVTDSIHGQREVGVEPDGESAWLVRATDRGWVPRLAVEADTPTAVVAEWQKERAGEVSIDLGELTEVDIRVVGSEGVPIAAAISVAAVGQGSPIYWSCILATDLAGRAKVHLRAGDYFMYASTGSAHALELIDFACKEPLTLTLQPLPTMRVRVLDDLGNPVVGARVQGCESSYGSRSADVRDKQMDRVAHHLWWSYAELAHSDANGVVRVPAFIRPGLTGKAKIVRGTKESSLFVIAPGSEGEVVVRN